MSFDLTRWDAITTGSPLFAPGGHSRMVREGAFDNMLSTLDRYALLQQIYGGQVPILDAIAKQGTSRERNTPNSQHFYGRALDLDMSGLSNEDRLRLLDAAMQAGFTGFGVGAGTFHIDTGPARHWNYGNSQFAGLPINEVYQRIMANRMDTPAPIDQIAANLGLQTGQGGVAGEPARSFPEAALTLASASSQSPSPGVLSFAQPAPEETMIPPLPPLNEPPTATSVPVRPFMPVRDFSGRMRVQDLERMASRAIDTADSDRVLDAIMRGEGPQSPEQIAQVAEQAISEAERQGMGPREIAMSMGLPAQNVQEPETPLQQASNDESRQQEGRKGFLEWLMPDLNEDQRQQALLAIGTGLLAGEDWSEGLAMAGQNLMGMRQGQLTQEREDQIREEDRAWELMMFNRRQEAAAQNTSSSNVYNRPFNVVGRDPQTGQEVVRQGILINGIAHVVGPDGNPVPAHTMLEDARVGGRSEAQDVTMGAGGIPNATSVNSQGVPSFSFQRESEGQAYSWAVRAINADHNLNAMIEHYGPEAFTSLSAGLMRWASQNAGSRITPSVINTIVDDSGMTGSMASAAAQYLQAVLRSDTGAAYTGVEIADYAGSFLPNAGDDTETVRQKRRDRELQLYALTGRTGAAAPYLLGVLDGTYDLPGERWSPPSDGALDSSNETVDPDIDDILSQYGL